MSPHAIWIANQSQYLSPLRKGQRLGTEGDIVRLSASPGARRSSMRIRKSPRHGLFVRPFEDRRRFHFAVTVYGFFDFRTPDTLLPEQEMWGFLKAEMGHADIDQGLPKIGGEVMVWGYACAPAGRAVEALRVSLSMGPVRKAVDVYGDRRWVFSDGPVGRLTVEGPAPFERMALTWENAYGGKTVPTNPLGKGLLADPAVVEGHPLPNLEHPDHRITRPDSVPPPACFAPIPLDWPRTGKGMAGKGLGTYDNFWLVDQFPGYPTDMDWAVFNMAPPDQRVRDRFDPGTAFEVTGMHPDHPVLRGRLPLLRPRSFVVLRGEEEPPEKARFAEVPLALETVWLFPHRQRGIVAWRGVVPIGTDDGADVTHLLCAHERQDDTPRTPAHYRVALNNRLARGEEAARWLVDYSDIEPPPDEPPDPDAPLRARQAALIARIKKKVEPVAAPAGAAPSALFKRYDEALNKVRGVLAQANKSPRQFLPQDMVLQSTRGFPMLNPKYKDRWAALMPPSDPNNSAGFEAFAERMGDIADRHARDAQMALGRTARVAGVNINDTVQTVMRKPGEAAVNQTTALRDMLTDSQAMESAIDSPAVQQIHTIANEADKYVKEAEKLQFMENKLDMLKKKQVDALRAQLPFDEIQQLKLLGNEVAIQRKAAEDAFRQFTYLGVESQVAQAGHSLTIAQQQAKDSVRAALHPQALQDLKNLPQDALVAATDAQNMIKAAPVVNVKDVFGFSPTDLDPGAKAAVNMVLHQVDMQGGDLAGVKFARSRIFGGTMDLANLQNIDLRAAVLSGVSLTRGDLRGGTLTDARFIDADLSASDFRGAELTNTSFIRCRLDGADFSGARMLQTSFERCSLARATFTGACITRGLFAECLMDEADCGGLRGEMVIIARCRGIGTVFRGSRVQGFRLLGESEFPGADFTGVHMPLSNFLQAGLRGALFDSARLEQSYFGSARLKQASMTHLKAPMAMFRKADLTETNLMGAHLLSGNLGSAKAKKANFSGATLFGAETLRLHLEDTVMAGANIGRTKMAIMPRIKRS